MGVTIHFRGKLRHRDEVHDLVHEVSDICETMSWKYQTYDGAWDLPANTSKFDLKGISFQPHDDCETVCLLFDNLGQVVNPAMLSLQEMGLMEKPRGLPWTFVKTQFAGPETHVAICKLFKHLDKRYFGRFEVNDDGGYYPEEDLKTLLRRMGSIDNFLQVFSETLEAVEPGQARTIEDLMKRIQQAVEGTAIQLGSKNSKIVVKVIDMSQLTGQRKPKTKDDTDRANEN